MKRQAQIVVRAGEDDSASVDYAFGRVSVDQNLCAEHVAVMPRQYLGGDAAIDQVHAFPTRRSSSFAMSVIVRISARSLSGNEMSYVSSSCSINSMISIDERPTSSTRSLSTSTTVPSSASWLTSSFRRAA